MRERPLHHKYDTERIKKQLTIWLGQRLDVVGDGVPPLVRGHARVAAEVVGAALMCARVLSECVG